MFDINILNKSNDREGMISKFECVKVIFSRAANDPNLNRYFDEDILKKVYSNIKVCSNDEKFNEIYMSGLTQKEKESLLKHFLFFC